MYIISIGKSHTCNWQRFECLSEINCIFMKYQKKQRYCKKYTIPNGTSISFLSRLQVLYIELMVIPIHQWKKCESNYTHTHAGAHYSTITIYRELRILANKYTKVLLKNFIAKVLCSNIFAIAWYLRSKAHILISLIDVFKIETSNQRI